MNVGKKCLSSLLFPKELHAVRTSPGGLVGAMQGLPSCESSPPHFLYFYFVV